MQETSTRTTLAEGMSLYGLKDSELFWDKRSDTKMLLAWNQNTIVCSFRGTATINNAMSDLQVRDPAGTTARIAFCLSGMSDEMSHSLTMA